jgi:hypothetical protein
MSVVVKLASTTTSLFFGYLFLNGHVQNSTLGERWLDTAAAVPLDARAGREGLTCHGGACHEECLWWVDEIGNATDTECSDYNLRRILSVRQLSDAVERAHRCADLASETCVLSHEVGLRAPAAMVYNTTEQRMRLYLLPRILEEDDDAEADGGDKRRVALFPVGTPPGGWSAASRHAIVPMRSSLRVEHYDAWQHELRTDVAHDEAAYCLQLLQRSVPHECALGGELPLLGDPNGRM